MKKIIRQILDDLKREPNPKSSIKPGALPPNPPNADLNSQILSADPKQRLRQLDFQAQQDEERQSSS